MREFVNDSGGKLAHSGLTSNEVFDLVQLASAAYDISFNASNYDLADGWFPITADLVEFGMVSDRLKNGYFYEANSFPADLLPQAPEYSHWHPAMTTKSTPIPTHQR